MDTQQHYVGVAGLVYHTTPPFLEQHTRAFPVSNPAMAWHSTHSSPPNSTSSSSSSLYSAITHSSDERVDYASQAGPTPALLHHHASHEFPGHHQSPSLDPGSSGQSITFGSPQIESSIGPSRTGILTRRRARAAAQGAHNAGLSPSSQPYDRRHSLTYAQQQQMSRPETPSGILAGPSQYQDSMGPGSIGQISAPPMYPFMPSHSRSTSGSASSSQPRSASPALSESSAMTSLSSSTSARARALNAFPPPFHESELEEGSAQLNKRKQRLSTAKRKEICIFHRDHPGVKQETIAAEFKVERSTVSKILKEKDRWLNIQDDERMQVAKWRPSKFPYLEGKLVEWLRVCKRDKVLLTDALIRSKAKEVAHEMCLFEDRFKASSGWVENFKARHGIKKGVWRGDGSNESRRSSNGAGAPSGTRSPGAANQPPRSGQSRPPDSTSTVGDVDGESDDEDARRLQESSSLPPTWDAPVPPSGIYGSPVPQLAMPDVVPLTVPDDQGSQAYFVQSMVSTREPGEMIHTVAEAETAIDNILCFFRSDSRRQWITAEQEDLLHSLKMTLFDRGNGTIRSG